jgi:hypothetical protein
MVRILTPSHHLYKKGNKSLPHGETLEVKKALYILSVWVGFGWWESEDIQGRKNSDG